ncbi:MAG TPA: isoprenylcysteine carboxylmethyltransferase family protein [Rhizomicrobium sp.]|nr:isoprenylcysteine carboxylmethyltransferase family protein [Rhizomicrobium sp.]
MGFWPDDAIFIPWDVWIVSWIVAGLWSARTVKRPNRSNELLYRSLTTAGFVLVLAPMLKRVSGHLEIVNWPGVLGHRFWIPPLALGWTMVGAATASFLFAWWARIYLGRLWSGAITRKEGHVVVDKGPYGIVRHPIYTGILGAAIATAVVAGSLHVILGAVCLIVGYWLKARLEERFLRGELGADAYDSYRRRVPMLVPFAPV